MLTQRPSRSSFDTQMLAMADELFNEFEELPVIRVIRAINAARSELRAAAPLGEAPTPEQIRVAARRRLRAGTGAPTAA